MVYYTKLMIYIFVNNNIAYGGKMDKFTMVYEKLHTKDSTRKEQIKNYQCKNTLIQAVCFCLTLIAATIAYMKTGTLVAALFVVFIGLPISFTLKAIVVMLIDVFTKKRLNNKGYISKYKEEILKPFLTDYYEGWNYDLLQKIDEDEFKNAGFMLYTTFLSDGVITGQSDKRFYKISMIDQMSYSNTVGEVSSGGNIYYHTLYANVKLNEQLRDRIKINITVNHALTNLFSKHRSLTGNKKFDKTFCVSGLSSDVLSKSFSDDFMNFLLTLFNENKRDFIEVSTVSASTSINFTRNYNLSHTLNNNGEMMFLRALSEDIDRIMDFAVLTEHMINNVNIQQ